MNKQFIRYVISSVVCLESLFLVLISFISLIYGEHVFFQYLLTGIGFGLIGFLGIRKKPESNVFFAKEGFIAVALSWIVMSIIGAIPVFLTKEIPNYIDALFEIVSGFTTTGSTICNDVEILSHTTLFWRSFTHWIGGMGILVFALAILPNAGGSGLHIMRAESPGPSVGKLVSKLSDTSKILYGIYIGITILEIICLLICKMPLFDSITLSLATAGTGGFGILNDSFVSYSSSVQVVATVFMLAFGVNFNVYYFALIGNVKEALKCEELRWYLGIVCTSALLIAFNTLSIFGNIFTSLKHGFFQVATVITTTGFASYDFDLWPSFSKTILVSLMFVGACAGSTGGGIKVSRFVILLKDLKNSLHRYVHRREVKVVKFEEKTVDKETVDSVKTYFGLYIFCFAFSLILISLNDFDFTTNFTAVTAALNNIGPGLNMVGPMCNFSCFNYFSKIILIFDMLTGRLELLPMLIVFAPLFPKKTTKRINVDA